MIISEMRSFQVGPYTVHQRPRPDNPAFSAYIVMLGERLIGRSFSVPDLACCQWLERDGVYATDSAQPAAKPLRGAVARRKRLVFEPST